MTTEAQSLPQAGPPKRKLRNFLLNPRFQLKYTGMVVVVTVVVASALGFQVYVHSTNLTASMTANQLLQAEDEEFQQYLIAEAEKADREVLYKIIGGIGVLALALGFTGIVVTHKVVGPSFKLRRLIGDVADGHLVLRGRLRKGDELQDVFLAFENMVERIRERQENEVTRLDTAIEKLRADDVDESALSVVIDVRDQMARELETASFPPPAPDKS